MKESTSFPSDPDKVGVGGLLAQWSDDRGAYVLAERIDEDTWTSVGYVFDARDASHIVEGWIAS